MRGVGVTRFGTRGVGLGVWNSGYLGAWGGAVSGIERPSEELTRNFILSEWENYRYQDGLRWSRLQTIALAEAALVTGVYSNLGAVTWPMKFGLALFLTGTIALLALLAEIDGRDAGSHLERAMAAERAAGLPRYVRPKRPLGLPGQLLLRIGFGMILAFNGLVVLDTVRHVVFPAGAGSRVPPAPATHR